MIENFNGEAERLLLNRDQFADVDALRPGAQRLEHAINSSRCLAVLDGKTPDEYRTNQPMRCLAAHYDSHQGDLALDNGSIAFFRLAAKADVLPYTPVISLILTPTSSGIMSWLGLMSLLTYCVSIMMRNSSKRSIFEWILQRPLQLRALKLSLKVCAVHT